MTKKVHAQRADTLAAKMADLKVGQEDLRPIADSGLKIEERLLQVIGHFYKYDSVLDKNLLVKQGVFLVVDRVTKPGDK